MTSVLFPDIPENKPIWTQAVARGGLEIGRVGPYVRLRFGDAVTIDRRATGVRTAVWYSCVGALEHARVVQFDEDALHIIADTAA